jgi:riboflavin kinase
VEKRLGLRPIEGYQHVVDDYGLPCTAQEFFERTIPLMKQRYASIPELPGASRLLEYIRRHQIPVALATSSLRLSMQMKIGAHKGWPELFAASVVGEDVLNGKPAPDIFLRAAELLNAPPESCLVIEDAPAGVQAGKAAGMVVLAVPSLPKKKHRLLYEAADKIAASLLDFRPEEFGLPPFDDYICGALPVEPWYLGGPVIKGFGRGSKVLGIPTANLPTSSFQDKMAEHTCGIYLGWAGLRGQVYKMVMSVGWNPYFDNDSKTVEPWLLHEFEDDFYDEELRLVVVGYIRPEANFPSLDALVERIHEDGRIAKDALDHPPYAQYGHDAYLRTAQKQQTV